jgi:hypothetical protein
MEPTNARAAYGDGAWTPASRFAFRAVCAYFGLFFIMSVLDVGSGPRAVVAAARNPPVRWFGHVVLRLSGSPNDGGALWAVAQQIVALLVAVAIASVWSLGSRRAEYRRLHGWFRIVLRYYVAVVMLMYGGFKVVETQFPPLMLDQLSQPLGSLAPMGLLWSFMGYSTAYASFTGFGESIGGFLLFFRRTTTAGALMLIAVLSNVALLNYAFDVPVKQLSANLLLAAMVLAVADVQRLIAVLVLNHASEPADLRFEMPRWLVRARRFVKPVIIVGATCVPLVVSFLVRRQLYARPPLFGIYDVERFVRNGAAIPPVLTETTRWRSVAVARRDRISIRLMNDSVRSLAATIDTMQHRITLSSPTDPRQKSALTYEQLGTTRLGVHGVHGADSIDVTLRRLDPKTVFRLMR